MFFFAIESVRTTKTKGSISAPPFPLLFLGSKAATAKESPTLHPRSHPSPSSHAYKVKGETGGGCEEWISERMDG